jgi:hypothetical protein
MLTLIVCSVVVLQVLGAVVMVAKMRRAPQGYEDAEGFHLGREPFVPLADKIRAYADGRTPDTGCEVAPAKPAESMPVWLAETHRLAS